MLRNRKRRVKEERKSKTNRDRGPKDKLYKDVTARKRESSKRRSQEDHDQLLGSKVLMCLSSKLEIDEFQTILFPSPRL